MIKLDESGDVIWQNKFYQQNRQIYPIAVEQMADGGYVVASQYYNMGSNESSVWLLKLDLNGHIQWQKAYSTNNRSGGFMADMKRTSDGGFIVASLYDGYYGWILKFDSFGDIEWQKFYLGSYTSFFSSIFQTVDDGYIVSGLNSASSADGQYVWVLKLDSSGEIQWQRNYGSRGDLANSIMQSSDAGYIMAGRTWSYGAIWVDALLIKLNSDGYIAPEDCTTIPIIDTYDIAVDAHIPETTTGIAFSATNIVPQVSNAILVEASLFKRDVCPKSAPNVTVNPSFLTFGSVELPSSSSQAVIVSNTGNANLSLNAITISGVDANAYFQSSSCSTVAPNASCTVMVSFNPTLPNSSCDVDVTFKPVSVGPNTATLVITSNSLNKPAFEIPLSGLGIDTMPPTVSINTSESILWPPNHKMVDVMIGGSASDAGSGIASVEITVADEYGVFNMTVPGFGSTIQLEASRKGTDKDGRRYTVTAVAIDIAGNQSMAVTDVIVPHDMR